MRILVVGQDGGAMGAIRDAVAQAGYGLVGAAASVREALVLAEGMNPDLVLLDAGLWDEFIGEDGLAGLPVVRLTAGPGGESLVGADGMPVGWLRKPVTSGALRAAVLDLLLSRK